MTKSLPQRKSTPGPDTEPSSLTAAEEAPASRSLATNAKSPSTQIKPSKQYDLFTSFFGDSQSLSNTIELWDAIPKYAISLRTQKNLRDEKGNLPVYEHEFLYRPTIEGLPKEVPCKMIIQPAHIKNPDGSYSQFYPSMDEELVEEVLRKIFTDQQFGQHAAAETESWVKFSLYMIQSELKARGKTRSLDEIKRSLEILSRAVITVHFAGSKGKMMYTNPILNDLTTVTREDYLEDPKSMCCTKMPALISKSVNELSYRQYNFITHMSLSSQLARWFHTRLCHQFIQASMLDTYHISYLSICRDSALLHQSRTSANIKTVDAALDELVKADVLLKISKDERRHGKKIIDVIYTLQPTPRFTDEIRTANARQGQGRVEMGIDPDLDRYKGKGFSRKRL